MTAAMPHPAQPQQPPDFQSVTIHMKNGGTLVWGRCRYWLEVTPAGMVLTVIARDNSNDRSIDDRFFAPLDSIEYVEAQASRLSVGLVS